MITIERCVDRVLIDLKNKISAARTHESALELIKLSETLEAVYSKQLEDANFYT